MSTRLVVMLPVRNGAEDLPGYFAAVAPFADAIVALDDGSTDETRSLLEAEPLVKVLLTNSITSDEQEWDDAENRHRLLQAAAALKPDWLLSLDADERFDPEDALALRRFVDEDAVPGCAYGFEIFRVLSVTDQYDPHGFWVYRLFAWEDGQHYPEKRLHFVPIPTSIPLKRWLRTTLRIQHLAGLTPKRREARIKMDRQADPDHSYQHSYRDPLSEPAFVLTWQPRPSDLPVLATRASTELVDYDDVLSDQPPVLSAIVISSNDETRIARSVAAVVNQECPWPFETIVVTSGTDRTAQIVREQFPEVTLIELPRTALPGEARNAGLQVARGDYVTFVGSQIELWPGSLAARIRAHDAGYALVTNVTRPGRLTRAGWAAYFLDHSFNLPGRPSTELDHAPAYCSYNRDALLAIGGFPEDMRAGEDTVVNQTLFQQGYVPYLSQDIGDIDHSSCETLPILLRHHFTRGRGFGRILLDQHRRHGQLLTKGETKLLLYRRATGRLRQVRRAVDTWGGDLETELRWAYPYVVAGATAASLGTLYEVLRPVRGQGKLLILFGKPVLTMVLAGLDRWHGNVGGRSDLLMVVRVDLIAKRIKIVSIPRDLSIEISNFGERKINAAHHLGAIADPTNPNAGARLLRTTIERTFGVEIDDHVVVEFYGFRRLIDLLGGITVDVPKAIHDDNYMITANEDEFESLHLEAGPQQMDGELALKYVRTRINDSDVVRRGRQIEVAKAMLRSAQALRSPRKIGSALRTANRVLQTSLSPTRKLLLAWVGIQMRPERIESSRLSPPLIEETRSETGSFIYRGDPKTIAEFVRTQLDLDESPPV